MKKGFSLIELIIVMAIIAILSGGVALGIGMINTSTTKSVAYNIESGLTKLKSMNMAGEEKVYMHVFENGGKYYLSYTNDTAKPSLDGSEKELCSTSNISIQVCYDEKDVSGALTSSFETLGSDEDICMGIKKKDGSFIFQESAGKKKAPAQIKVVSSGSSTSYLVYMVTSTGKHHVEVQ